MKLSEAIRLGATLGPQRLHDFFGKYNASCAIGAAMLAMGTTSCQDLVDSFLWASASVQTRKCPVCGIPGSIWGLITHLNDEDGWTREAIADWVEQIEPAESEQSKTPVEETVSA